MDLSSASQDASEVTKLQPKHASVSTSIDGAIENEGVQDEKALKKQQRLIANRASAEKSRIKKRTELEQLRLEVVELTNKNQALSNQNQALSNENEGLRNELLRVSDESNKFSSENKLLKDELLKFCGPDFVSKLVKGDAGAA